MNDRNYKEGTLDRCKRGIFKSGLTAFQSGMKWILFVDEEAGEEERIVDRSGTELDLS
jgi:hypothetical protein